MNREFTEMEKINAIKQIKKWSNSLIIRESQIKITRRYHFSTITFEIFLMFDNILHW